MGSWGKAPPSNKNSNSLGTSGLSNETQRLLEDAMKKRGLSMRAMQDVTSSLKAGDSGWVDRLNTGTANFSAPPSKTQAAVKVPTFKQAHKPLPTPPASFSGKRMQHQMPAPERDMWVGRAPGPDRDAEKERLSKVMELGPKGMKELEERTARAKQAALQQASREKQLDVKEALIDQLVDEVRERREFLEAMRAAGKGQQYEAQIRGEIAVRLKELERMGVDTRGSAPPAAQQRVPPAPYLRQ